MYAQDIHIIYKESMNIKSLPVRCQSPMIQTLGSTSLGYDFNPSGHDFVVCVHMMCFQRDRTIAVIIMSYTYPSFTHTQPLLSSGSYIRIHRLQSMTPHRSPMLGKIHAQTSCADQQFCLENSMPSPASLELLGWYTKYIPLGWEPWVFLT